MHFAFCAICFCYYVEAKSNTRAYSEGKISMNVRQNIEWPCDRKTSKEGVDTKH